MYIESGKQAVILDESLAWDLREVGEHLADLHSQEIDDPRQAAVRIFVHSYLDQFHEDFVEDDDGRSIYCGTAGE